MRPELHEFAFYPPTSDPLGRQPRCCALSTWPTMSGLAHQENCCSGNSSSPSAGGFNTETTNEYLGTLESHSQPCHRLKAHHRSGQLPTHQGKFARCSPYPRHGPPLSANHVVIVWFAPSMLRCPPCLKTLRKSNTKKKGQKTRGRLHSSQQTPKA